MAAKKQIKVDKKEAKKELKDAKKKLDSIAEKDDDELEDIVKPFVKKRKRTVNNCNLSSI